MASVEDILLLRAMQDQEDRPSYGQAIGTGASIGALGGMLAGQPVHMLGNTVNSALNRQGRIFKPGPRMAGGLVGAIVGGALGAGTRALAMNESPAARLLAKAQTQGELSYTDKLQLEDLLADTYSNMG